MRGDVAWFNHARNVGCLPCGRRVTHHEMKHFRYVWGIACALTGVAAAMSVSAQVLPATAAEIPPGAASCTGCHPAKSGVETPVPRLAGQDAGKIVTTMQAFRSGTQPATVMGRIAKGFSDDEIKAIAAWFGAQSHSPD